MNDAVLQCRQLSKHFVQGEHRLQVLDGLELCVAKGEKLAIIGVSGSGKTTLLNLLGGIDNPSSGQVLVSGQDISALKATEQDQLRNRALGFVYQFHHLLGEFSAQENVAMPLIIARRPYRECLDRAAALLEEVGLKERLTHKPAQLSGGERQRVAIARALVNAPACVLMDEPTGNLDRHSAQAIHNLILRLNEQFNISFVLVTHDNSLAQRMDRTLVLRDGRLHPLEQG
ncbi:MAG: lipoprotein-releasing ABC transporter ATP-binding protein LolD [Pseudomonadales bacterium]|jgi:lipoprotein-releasing system ATP-binding protein|nr:lipoprotein-releasing ABC transporter ATP-binding protein LolD [Pseudomonadales bacterium]